MDEKSESDAPEVPAIELVPKEQIAARVVRLYLYSRANPLCLEYTMLEIMRMML